MTIDPRIRVDLEEHECWRRTLSFTVPADVMRAEREKTLEQVGRRLKLPGYRKGKAPAAAVERHSGPAVGRETLERVIGETYRRALVVRDLQPITEGEIHGVDYRPGGALTFQASFEVRPVIRPARLAGFRVVRPPARVDATRVEHALRRLLEENAIWRPPDDRGKARDGDLVTVQILPLGDPPAAGQGVGLPWARRLRLKPDTDHRGRYQFVIGEGEAAPDLERAVLSLDPGESGEFTVRSDAEGRNGEHAPSATLRVRVTLEDRRMRELPDLDDAFARSLGDFPDLAALRSRILAELESEARAQADAVLRARLLDQLLSANPFDAPPSLVAQWRRSFSDNELAESSTRLERADAPGASSDGSGPGESAEVAVKRALLIAAVAEQNGLAATRDEIEGRIREVASLGGVTPDQVRERLISSGRMKALESDITERKVFEFLIARSQVVDEG
jgi:trigger factor